MGIREILDDYVLTMLMIVLVMGVAAAGGHFGMGEAELPTGELLGGLLVLAGKLIKSP